MHEFEYIGLLGTFPCRLYQDFQRAAIAHNPDTSIIPLYQPKFIE